MEWSPEILARVEAYLSGAGSEQDRHWVEQQMEQDTAFKERVEEMRRIGTASRISKLKDQFQHFQALEKNLQKNNPESGDLSEGSALSTEKHYEHPDTTPTNKNIPNVEYSQQDIMYAGIRAHMGKALFSDLQQLEQSMDGDDENSDSQPIAKTETPKRAKSHRPKATRRIWLGLAIAASLALLVVFNWDRLRPMSEGEKLFWEEFEPYPYSDQVRSERKTAFTELDQALAYYVQGDYRRAVRIFDRIDLESLSEEQKLAAAYAFLGVLDCENAIMMSSDIDNYNSNWKKKILELCALLDNSFM